MISIDHNQCPVSVGFYLTDEECKYYKTTVIASGSGCFYLTDEECKLCTVAANVADNSFVFYLTDEECKFSRKS